ncbi:MAG: hypothetical protein EVA87_02740 [Rhodospirillaceae bacterium]|nr:MAG: hypothetical protein EVA87_02740 [Rhodospirillaceae bacterium]
MTVTLEWQGPVGADRIPNDPLIFENLCQAGVYLRIKSYDGGRIIAYAGQSVSLLARFDQHLSAMLGLASPLRDEIGGEVFTGDAAARLEAYGDLNRVTALAAADVRRVRFLYALCDDYFHTEHMNLAEGLLQRRIVQRIADVENAVSAPGVMPNDVPDRWTNDFSALEDADRDLLYDLLGDDAMTLDMMAGNAV